MTLPLLSLPVWAGEDAEPTTVKHEGESGEKKEAWEEYRHYFTGFGGANIGEVEAEEGEPSTAAAPAVGLDYSYRVSKLVGVGAYFDYAYGRFHELLVGPSLFIFPWEGLFFEVAPSLAVSSKNELFFVARVAVGYEFELTPQFLLGLYAAFDGAIEGEKFKPAFVPGITVGYGF